MLHSVDGTDYPAWSGLRINCGKNFPNKKGSSGKKSIPLRPCVGMPLTYSLRRMGITFHIAAMQHKA